MRLFILKCIDEKTPHWDCSCEALIITIIFAVMDGVSQYQTGYLDQLLTSTSLCQIFTIA